MYIEEFKKLILKESELTYLGNSYINDMLSLYAFVEKNEKEVEFILDLIVEHYDL